MLAPAIEEHPPVESDAGEQFPSGIEVFRLDRRHRSGEAPVPEQWTCLPRTVAEVVTIVNWACRNDWRVSAAGADTPRSAAGAPQAADAETLYVDLSRYMNRARIDRHADGDEPATVTAQTGITLDALLTQLEYEGYGLASCPATGDITLGSALVVSGHDSISNLVMSVTVIVWDTERQQYVARTVNSADPRMAALLAHQGRALIVAATLRVDPAQRVRCVSRTDLGTASVFAPSQKSGQQSFAALLQRCDRIESVWFPFTPAPWLKLWSVTPQRPSTAREVDAPYNFPFADGINERQSDLIRQLIDGESWATPLFTGLSYAATVGGLHAIRSADLWGWAKNTQLYLRPTALRFTLDGYAVLTTRQRVQYVVSTFYAFLSSALERHRAEGRFPVNGPWELRVTRLDDPAEADFDTVVWLNVLTMPGTPDAQSFYAELDSWITTAFDLPHEKVLRQPDNVQDAAPAILDRLDPHSVFARAA
ncbi:MAG: cholesterol oxidase substrate-binding domain-containing protein [Actinocrinis sp.]